MRRYFPITSRLPLGRNNTKRLWGADIQRKHHIDRLGEYMVTIKLRYCFEALTW